MARFAFARTIEFIPEQADEILRALPAGPGVMALRGARAEDEPYLARAADLRRRVRRLLASPDAVDEQGRPVLSRRLNLRDRVRTIEWTATGSEFESTLQLYCATRAIFGPESARKRLRLTAPFCVRLTRSHALPRLYVTNRIGERSLDECFGPFPSRLAAELYCDAVLDLFQLRRCWEDLVVSPDHPGCVFGEIRRCMEPCKCACTPEQYAAAAEAVWNFLLTRGQSMLTTIAADRDRASEEMDFERAASLHAQFEKVKASAALADELVGPLRSLRALVLQTASPSKAFDTDAQHGDEAAAFLFAHGELVGPEPLSTRGVRAVREQTAVGSSLFAQPLMLAAVPLDEPAEAVAPTALSPEDHARAAIAQLEEWASAEPEIGVRCDFLSLLRRWYYRPAKSRSGELFLPNADGSWPVRRVLNGAARIVLGPPKEAAPVEREAAAAMKTKVLHEGRPDVERVVPMLPKRSRAKKQTLNAPSAEETGS